MKVMKLPGLHCSREKPLGEEPSWKTLNLIKNTLPNIKNL